MELRDYQLEAIQSWSDSKYCSIWEMATGTGKTFTATFATLSLAEELRETRQSVLIVIVCPLLDLVDQWVASVEGFGQHGVRAAEGSINWLEQFTTAVVDLSSRPGRVRVVVATMATFASGKFQNILRSVTSNVIFVGDEVHNFGSARYQDLLPKKARFRLGLSATPRRWNDSDGTDAILQYFGDVSFVFDIKTAIQRGALTPYRYQPRLTEMSALEAEHYAGLTVQLAAILRGRSLAELNKEAARRAGALLTARSALIGGISPKWEMLKKDLESNLHRNGQLIYCSPGTYPLGSNEREIDLAGQLLKKAGFGQYRNYESLTQRSERLQSLADFKAGSVKYLISMRCLDEGVDIPSAEIAYFIASSANPRQFIQRRGRVLRKHPGKEHAVIYDYFMLPRKMSYSSDSFALEQSIGKKELQRTLDFIGACNNQGEALAAIKPLLDRYGEGN